MRPPWRALRFLAVQQGLVGRPAVPEQVVLGETSMDVVAPTAPYRGTVLTVHGMSPLAQRDPRMLRLHGALAALGLRVVSPHIPSIAALRIHAGQIDDVERTIAVVARDRALCPSGRRGVCAGSFSAGISLVAASRPRVADRISAICAVGAFGDIEDVMRALLTRDDVTTYAWKIVLANFVDLAFGARPDVARALTVAALDEWHGRPHGEAQLDGVLAGMAPEDRTLASALLTDPRARMDAYRRIRATRPLILDQASVVDHLGGLRAPVTLLHGDKDPTIPSCQSRAIHRACREAGVASRLVVSPLLGHGDAVTAPGSLWALPILAAGLQGWIDEVDEVRPAPRAHRVGRAAWG